MSEIMNNTGMIIAICLTIYIIGVFLFGYWNGRKNWLKCKNTSEFICAALNWPIIFFAMFFVVLYRLIKIFFNPNNVTKN
jgi:hypothetical protein